MEQGPLLKSLLELLPKQSKVIVESVHHFLLEKYPAPCWGTALRKLMKIVFVFCKLVNVKYQDVPRKSRNVSDL